ncbi:unnamed protein product [Toxocara canis]|uniref:EGF-like domain-containing protein n=1 Tax=Toxocara canis TaxID=6265 RepID=A0A183U2Y5_TOXCA|nr:unnamed protein product [Toxocara canis]
MSANVVIILVIKTPFVRTLMAVSIANVGLAITEMAIDATPAVSGVGGGVEGGCRSHQECHQWGECVFGQNGEAGHCRCRGWYVGDGVRHCGPPGEQPQSVITDTAQRQDNTGNLCGGYTCDTNADCMPAPRGGDECVCRAGYHGNGVQCEPHVETMRPIVYPVGVGK